MQLIMLPERLQNLIVCSILCPLRYSAFDQLRRTVAHVSSDLLDAVLRQMKLPHRMIDTVRQVLQRIQ